jgi:ElaB/YqjD/DUF883 family membrane-anchored ribosome-binding protein
MSSSDTPARHSNKTSRTAEEISAQIDGLRSDIQNLATTVTNVAGKQLTRAQDSLETSIRNNPIAAVGIAAAIGFLYAMIRR